MAKDDYTALVATERFCAWTTATSARRGFTIQSRGEAVVPVRDAASEDSEESPAVRLPTFAEVVLENAGQINGEVVLGLTTDELLLKVVELPSVEDEDLAGMVELQADKLSPFPIEQMTVSHEVLSRTESSCTVLIAASPTRYIERLGAAFTDAGIKLERVDAAAMGWWRVLSTGSHVDVEGVRVLFVVDHHYLEMIVVRDGIPYIFRSYVTSDDAVFAEDVASEVALTLVALEIQSDGDFQPHLSAWSAEGEGDVVFAAIEKTCKRKLERADLKVLGECADGILQRHTEGVSLNLTPTSWLSARAAAALKKRLIGSTVAVLGVWCLSVAAVLGYLYYEQNALDKLVAERDVLNAPAMEVRALRRRVFMVEQYMNRDDSALECLRELVSMQPRGIELSSYDYSKKNNQIRVSGFGASVNDVYEFKTKLEASTLFCESKLTGPRKTTQGETFEVRMTLCKEDAS
jgi:hypothetical protein